MRPTTLYAPDLVRKVLADAADRGIAAASRASGVPDSTIWRWQKRRQAESYVQLIADSDRTEMTFVSHVWPTDDDVAAWHEAERKRRDVRDKRAQITARYRKRRYLSRGKPLLVPSWQVARRLQALQAIGHTQRVLAKRLGFTTSQVGYLTSERYPTVSIRTKNKVDRVYRELCGKPPADTWVTRKVRAQAKAKGWVSVMAWDNIDDPNEKPHRSAKQSKSVVADERREALREMLAAGENARSAAMALGIDTDALWKWCDRNGERDLWEALSSRCRTSPAPGSAITLRTRAKRTAA